MSQGDILEQNTFHQNLVWHCQESPLQHHGLCLGQDRAPLVDTEQLHPEQGLSVQSTMQGAVSHPCQLQAHGFVPGFSGGHRKSAGSHQAGAPTSPTGSACKEHFVPHTSLGEEVQFASSCVHTCVLFSLLGISYRGVFKNVCYTRALKTCKTLCSSSSTAINSKCIGLL